MQLSYHLCRYPARQVKGIKGKDLGLHILAECKGCALITLRVSHVGAGRRGEKKVFHPLRPAHVLSIATDDIYSDTDMGGGVMPESYTPLDVHHIVLRSLNVTFSFVLSICPKSYVRGFSVTRKSRPPRTQEEEDPIGQSSRFPDALAA